MKGHLRERKPGVFECIVDAGPDPVTGKRRQISRTFRGGKRGAQNRLAELIQEVNTGKHASTAGTFGSLLDAWLDATEKAGRADTTMRGYRQVCDTWLRPDLGDLPLSKITTRRLEQTYAKVTEAGRSANTVSHVHAVARGALNQALRWGWISTNPALATRRPHVARREQRPPTLKELADILQAAYAQDEDLGRLLRVAVAVGARRSELCGLQWPDIDLEHGLVHIRRAVVVAKGKPIVKDTKVHQVRHVEIDAGTVEALREHRAAVELRCEDLRIPLVRNPFVFTRDPSGEKPLRPEDASKAFAEAAMLAGVVRYELDDDGVEVAKPGARLHDLRHLNATLQLAAGVPLATVSARLGHFEKSTTQDIYSHALPGSGRAAADILGGLLDAGHDEPAALPR